MSCLKYTKQKQKNLLLIQNILAYELVRRAFFLCVSFCQNDFPVPINCLNCQSELVMPKIYQTEAKKTTSIFKLYWRTSLYAVHFCPKKWRTSLYAHTFLLHFKFVKTDFLCLQATLSVVLTCFYPKHGSQKPMNP